MKSEMNWMQDEIKDLLEKIGNHETHMQDVAMDLRLSYIRHTEYYITKEELEEMDEHAAAMEDLLKDLREIVDAAKAVIEREE